MSKAEAALSVEEWDRLAEEALRMRDNSYAPYSKFRVGSAILLPDGEMIFGANVENAVFGLTVCAEQNAINGGVIAGKREFKAIAVASGSDNPCPPCGVCMQALSEFVDDIPILLVNPKGLRRYFMLSDLMRVPYSTDDLISGQG